MCLPFEYKSVKKWLSEATSKASLTDWLIVFLTLAIVYLAWSGGKQTDDLITAAKKKAEAADRFSRRADNIKAEIADAVESFKSMTKANQESADAATTSSSTAKAALEVSERAFVGVTTVTMDKDFADGVDTTVSVTILNSGKTPAYNVHTRHYFNYGRKPNPDGLPFSPVEMISTAVVLPLVQYIRASDKVSAPPKEVRDMIRQGSLAFIAYGIIEYTDVFKKKRITKYCNTYDPASPLTFQVCPVGNEAK